MKAASFYPYVPAINPGRLKRLGLCLVMLLLISACGQQDTTPPPATLTPGSVAASTTPSAPVATATKLAQAVATPTTTAATPTEQGVSSQATATTASPAASGGSGTFTNPVFQSDFADPYVMQVANIFYGYATEASSAYVQVARSNDMVHWQLLPDAMPVIPPWVDMGHVDVWAPSVIQVGQKFIMYFSARDSKSGKECLGQATSDKPEGRFNKTSDQPFMCKPEEGGEIDPFVFKDGDKLYLNWKNDGNSIQLPANLYAQELSPDGMSLVGSPAKLISNDQVWEGRVVEAPEMFKHDNKYYLFYSGGNYADPTYATGYATCNGPMGPCTQAPEGQNPILKSKMDAPPLVMGPGGETLMQIGDQTWMFYHAWQIVAGARTDSRFMWLDKVDWQNNQPVVKGPTTAPQPDPAIK